MKFNSIDSQLTDIQIQAAEQKFGGLLCELACRSNNEYVGSSMGGNLHQLITLLNMRHTLNIQSDDIQICGGYISWCSNWLSNTPRKDIRIRLNQVFDNIDASHQQPALDFEQDRLNNYPINRSVANQEVLRSLEDGSYQQNKYLTNIEQFQQARFICQELAARLDQNDTSLIEPVGQAMQHFSKEILLVALRKFITIERVIRFALDEEATWSPMLLELNKKVDGE